jgi:hypothetical protein
MTKFHKSDGVWTRCKAVVRPGQGVEGCPLELEGVELKHTVGLQGIAAAGGGTMRRWIAEDTYRETKIMPLGDGTFMTSTGKTERVYTMEGKIIPLKDRVRELRREQRARELPTLTVEEQRQANDDYLRLQEDVTIGLSSWGTEAGDEFRDRALGAATAAERELFTSASLALLLEVARRPNVPAELEGGLRAVDAKITSDPDPLAYVIQKAREEKRDRAHYSARAMKEVDDAGLTYEQALVITKTAPRDLRRFFRPELASTAPNLSIFDARRALYNLALDEMRESERQSFLRSGDRDIAEDALTRIATPSFQADDEWQRSVHRRVLSDYLPRSLARLEEQSEEAWLHRQLAAV